MSKSVSLGINTERFMKRVLGRLFENPGRALSEAMQNSRRAGATEIRFLIAADPADPALSVVHIADNGSGILDWDKLLTVAESGWDTGLADKEDAFGVGFAALLFSCRVLTIRSRGRELVLNKEAAVQRTRFPVVESKLAPATGTVIRMEGYALRAPLAELKVVGYAEGFPLPVFLDEKLLSAPYRLSESFVQTAVGRVAFGSFGADGSRLDHAVKAFYQGLPIDVPVGRKAGLGDKPSIVIHVDETAFPATAPDRAGLCDPDAFQRKFAEEMRRLWGTHLRTLSSKLSPQDFVERYWDWAIQFDCVDLLDRCPVLPSSVLSTVEGFAYIRCEGDSNRIHDADSVSRADVESGRVVLAEVPFDEESEDGFAFLTLGYVLGWRFVVGIPEQHWAHRHLVRLDEQTPSVRDQTALSVDVYAVSKRSARFSGAWIDVSVQLVDRYAIALKDRFGRVVHSAEIDHLGLYREGALIVPAKENGDMLCRQVSRYTDDNEAFREESYEADNADLQDLIAELRGRSAGATIAHALAERKVAARPGVGGTVAAVIIGHPTAGRDGEKRPGATQVIELPAAAIAEWLDRFANDAQQPFVDLRRALEHLLQPALVADVEAVD